MTTIPQDELQRIAEELSYPSALQLKRAVRIRERARARHPRPADYEPWTITLKDARAFVAKLGQRQTTAPTERFAGKIQAHSLDSRWAADLISYVAQPASLRGKRMSFVLVVQDIFSREIWTRPLPDSKGETVLAAYAAIRTATGRAPKELNVDRGPEWTAAAFLQRLRDDNTELRVGRGKNDLATLDSGIAALRKALTKRASTPGGGNWAQELAAATEGYNNTPRDRLGGEVPESVEDNLSLRFDLQKQAGRDAAQQDSLTRARREKIQEVGAFRAPVETKQLKGLTRRGFKPTFEAGQPRKLARLDGDEAVDTQGRRSKIKEVLPAAPDSTAVREPPGPPARGDARITARRRAATTALAGEVLATLEQPRRIAQITTALTPAQKAVLREQKLKNTRAFLSLHPDRFRIQGQLVSAAVAGRAAALEPSASQPSASQPSASQPSARPRTRLGALMDRLAGRAP